MRNTVQIFMTAMILAILAGCAGNGALVKTMGTSTSRNIFQEIDEHAPSLPGYVDLSVYSSLKTHNYGIYANKDLHGTPEYTLLVNIDGQVAALKGRINGERNEARPMGDPEEGEGIRYRFTRKLRVKAGAHRIAIALPADGLLVERDVILSEGETNSLTVEPVYRTIPGMPRPGAYNMSSFMQGIRSINVLFNGKTM